ncbi:MAG: hypothetical protein WAQ99_10505 [Pyrinomonadaceae bacterium]
MELTKEKKEMIIKTIEVRLSGVSDATKRGRLAFLVITVASCAILITLWNAYFSYTRTMAFDKKASIATAIVPAAVTAATIAVNQPVLIANPGSITQQRQSPVIENQPVLTPNPGPITQQRQLPLYEFNRRIVVDEWARNLNVSIGLLGIDINVNEFSLLGSFGLTIISVWYFFSLRRENRAIVSLLRDVTDDLNIPIKSEEGKAPTWNINRDDDKWDIANLAFHGVAQSLIFVNTGTDDKPMSGHNIFKRDRVEGKENESVGVIDKFVVILTKVIRKLILLLIFSPAITIFLSIWADYYSLNLISPFREESRALKDVITQEAFRQFFWENRVALFLGGLTLAICFSCAIFQLRTAQALKDFESKLYPEPK